MTTKKKVPKPPVEFDEYAEAKKAITEKVVEVAGIAEANNPRRVLRFPVDGCRNYELESDGTLWMQYGATRIAHGQWTAREWSFFENDCRNNLWGRIDAFANR